MVNDRLTRRFYTLYLALGHSPARQGGIPFAFPFHCEIRRSFHPEQRGLPFFNISFSPGDLSQFFVSCF